MPTGGWNGHCERLSEGDKGCNLPGRPYMPPLVALALGGPGCWREPAPHYYTSSLEALPRRTAAAGYLPDQPFSGNPGMLLRPPTPTRPVGSVHPSVRRSFRRVPVWTDLHNTKGVLCRDDHGTPPAGAGKRSQQMKQNTAASGHCLPGLRPPST